MSSNIIKNIKIDKNNNISGVYASSNCYPREWLKFTINEVFKTKEAAEKYILKKFFIDFVFKGEATIYGKFNPQDNTDIENIFKEFLQFKDVVKGKEKFIIEDKSSCYTYYLINTCGTLSQDKTQAKIFNKYQAEKMFKKFKSGYMKMIEVK